MEILAQITRSRRITVDDIPVIVYRNSATLETAYRYEDDTESAWIYRGSTDEPLGHFEGAQAIHEGLMAAVR